MKPYRNLSELLNPFSARLSTLRSHENNDLSEIRAGIKKLLKKNFPHETGSSGYEDRLVLVKVSDASHSERQIESLAVSKALLKYFLSM